MSKNIIPILTGMLIAFIGFSIFWVFQKEDSQRFPLLEKNISENKSQKDSKKVQPQEKNLKKLLENQKNSQETVKKEIKKTDKDIYQEYITEAKKLLDNKYYSLASRQAAEAIKKNPNQIKAYSILGEIYFQTNELWKIENLITRMESIFPEHPEVLIIKTRQFIAARKYQEVLDLLAGIENPPAVLKYYKAVLLALQNNHKEAKKILKSLSSVEISPDTYNDRINLITGEESQKIGDLKTVYLEFEELVEPEDPHLFASLAKALAQNNEFSLAREFTDIAIAEDINYIDGWLIRGFTHLSQKNYAQAENDLRQSYELDPIRPETQYFLALALLEQKKYKESLIFFEKTLDYDFEFSEEVRWKLLDIYAQQKKYDKVLEFYKNLLTYNSEPKRFISAVHTAVDLLKKPEEALIFSKLLLKKNTKDQTALNIHAWALIANKKLDEAELILNKTLTLNTKNPRTLLNLGILYQKQKKLNKAKETFKKSYTVGLDQPDFVNIVNLASQKYNKLLEVNLPKEKTPSLNPENSP